MSSTYLDNFPVLDGFLFSTKLRCDLTFRNLAIQQYEALRRAGGFRQKEWPTPQDSLIKIPARNAYKRQLWLPPGSVIWGYSFIGTTGEQPEGTLSWEVFDACDDVPLFSEMITRTNAAQNPAGGVNQVPQQYLSKLMIVGPPGLLNITICNTFGVDQVGQLVLYGGEPVA
jgi:hypothetical protein